MRANSRSRSFSISFTLIDDSFTSTNNHSLALVASALVLDQIHTLPITALVT